MGGGCQINTLTKRRNRGRLRPHPRSVLTTHYSTQKAIIAVVSLLHTTQAVTHKVATTNDYRLAVTSCNCCLNYNFLTMVQ